MKGQAVYVLVGVVASFWASSPVRAQLEERGCCYYPDQGTCDNAPRLLCTLPPLVRRKLLTTNVFNAGQVCGTDGLCHFSEISKTPPPPPPSPDLSGTTLTGLVQSDPIFTGFDNSRFEFFGEPGSSYAVLTSDSFTVNMHLVEAGPRHVRHQGGQGTFVGSLAVLLPSLELIAHVSTPGDMTLTLNGTAMDMASPSIWGVVDYDPYRPDVGQAITLTHPPYSVSIVAVKQYSDEASGYNRGHFDLSVEMTGPAESMVGGVLGQTLYSFTEIDDASFKIPSLTWRNNSISEAAMHMPSSSRRRLLTVKRDIKFPSHAGLAGLSVIDQAMALGP